MGREIVYCWKCATRLQGSDFQENQAFRVGDKVSCPNCVDELVADLSAEEQEAILNPPKKDKSQPVKKISSTNMKPVEKTGDAGTSRRTGTVTRARTGTTGPVPKQRTGTTGPVPTASTGVRKRVTASIPKVQPPADEGEEGAEAGEGGEKPPMDEKKKKILILGGVGGGLFLTIVVLLIIVLTRKPEVKKKHVEDTAEETKAKVAATPEETPKEKAVKALLKDAFEIKAKQPDALGAQLKKFREAETAAEGSTLLNDVRSAIDEVLVKIDKAISAVDEQVKPQYLAFEYKTVIEAYEKAKSQHDVPEWTDRLDTKIKLVRNKIDDTFHQFKRKIETAKEAGEDPKIEEVKATIAKWEMPEYNEKLEKFLALMSAAEPDPSKTPAPEPDAPPKTPGAPALKPLTAAMKAFFPTWQGPMTAAFGRDYAAAATEMSGLAARADSEEAKKAAAEDAQALKDIGGLYADLLKAPGETPKLSAVTLEYQEKPGEWKEVAGKAVKVDPTRMEVQPDAKDGKTPPPILIEYTDLNAGSLAVLYKARKKPAKNVLDLLTRFALIEGASKSAAALGGSAPDRFWHLAAEAREKAPKPNSREFEARLLFHQSEFEWRKVLTRYTAIEKSKRLLEDYTGTNILKKYQAIIRERAETGKDYSFLPHQLNVNGDYNTFKNPKKEDPAWIATKQIDFKDSLFNYVEAEFVALPNVSYKCWVYAGGCCQEVWNGSYQVTEGTTANKGKQVPIDPGSQMAAPLPLPGGLKKNHDDHKPKAEKGKPPPEHPKTPAKWEWIQIPMPKTFIAPGAKQVRILTDQPGFGVKYILVSSTRTKAPDEALAKDLAKEAVSGPAAKPEIKGTPDAKEWFIIGPFPEGLGNEQAPEKEIDVTKEYQGKTAKIKWRLVNATIKGAQAEFNWEKGPFNPKDQVSAYALIHVKAPAAMDAKLWIGHDDGGRAWLNGQKVHDKEKSGALKADEFNAAIKLEEGWNRLLIKVNNNNDKFGMIMRITDPAKAAIPGLEYSAYGDSLEQP